MNGLNQIISTITNYSAITFAENKLKILKHDNNINYYTYMRDCFSGEEYPTIEKCEQNALIQFINEYSKCCELYTGWMNNGRVFILDRRDKVVLFLYKKDDTTHSSVVHYNPLDIDLIEQSCSNDHFFKGVETGRFDISKDEDHIIKECDRLVACKHNIAI